MSTIQVSNIDFESTANNQLVYAANTVTVRVGGSNVFTVNSTSMNIVANSNVIPGGQSTSGTVSANTLSINSNGGVVVTGSLILNGTVTPTEISSNTIGWSPGITNKSVVRLQGNTSVTTPIYVYGMTAGVNGQIIILSNIGTKQIIFESESSSETTNGNKFAFPTDITLNGYQSISVIYDGISARWKPTDNYLSQSGGFYKNQLYKGFFSGGTQQGGIPTVRSLATFRTTYASETTAAVPGANLSATRYNMMAAGNACKGFFAGGILSPARTSSTEKGVFASETMSLVPGNTLSGVRAAGSAAGNACKGFFSGGCAGAPTLSATADRTTYASETTAAVPGANLTQARALLAAAGNACKGFFIGGTPCGLTRTALADKTTYSTETTAAVSGANLINPRCGLIAAGNECKGFFSGGERGPPINCVVATADRTTYSTETTAAVPGANLTQARTQFQAAGNGNKGFFIGAVGNTRACRTNYSTETTAFVPGANLGAGKGNGGAI